MMVEWCRQISISLTMYCDPMRRLLWLLHGGVVVSFSVQRWHDTLSLISHSVELWAGWSLTLSCTNMQPHSSVGTMPMMTLFGICVSQAVPLFSCHGGDATASSSNLFGKPSWICQCQVKRGMWGCMRLITHCRYRLLARWTKLSANISKPTANICASASPMLVLWTHKKSEVH